MADDVQTKILQIEVDYEDALTKIAQYRIEIEKVKEQQKSLKEMLKQGQISQVEYQKSMESSKMVISQYNGMIGTLTKTVQNQLKQQNEQSGSLVQLRAKLSNLTSEYDRLSKAERESAKGKELKDKINAVTTELKGCEEETQRYYRNVGNYPEAMAPMREQLDILVTKLSEMKQAGLDTTPAFDEMQNKAEELRSKLEETSEGSVSVTQRLQGGITDLVAVFAIWNTALEGLGVENEDLNRTISICITGITAAGTAFKIWNAVNKEGAILTAATAAKTWLLNTALATKLTATTAVTAAEGGATVATLAWNAALYANPLVWLIAIIVAAVAAVYALVKAFSWFFSGSQERKEALKQEAEQLERLHELNEQAVEMAEARGASEAKRSQMTIQNLKAEKDAWEEHFRKIKEEYDEDDDEYKEALESKKKAQESYQESLRSGLIYLTKIQTEQREKEREKALGVWKYKKTLIEEEIQDQKDLALTLYRSGQMTLEQYQQMIKDLNTIKASKLADVDKEEAEAAAKAAEAANKKRQEAAKAAKDAADKRKEEERKRQEEYEKEFQAGQDALLAIVKEGLDKQLQAETYAYERALKLLKDKLAKYKTDSEYDVKMRQAINDQIYALTVSHERKVAEFQYSEAQRQIKIQEEIIQQKLALTRKGTLDDLNLRMAAIGEQEEADKLSLDKRLADGELSQEQYNVLRLTMEENYRQQKLRLSEEYDQLDLDRQKAALQAEIDAMQLAEDERQLKMVEGYQMSDEAYAEWRQRGLEGMDQHEAAILLKAEENAQKELEALQARGQLSTQTTEEYEAEILAAKQKSQQAQAATNQAIIKDEQAKAQAMKAVTTSLTGLLDTLGESNSAFAKMSKIITLAQIAIDTGKALSAGIASASSLPFPANLAAIATTVATVLANVATAIQTVKSAKFAQGGKVTGPGTGTSDDIPAMLSNGEFVMTAAATKMFEPLLVAMNGIGRGVPMQVAMSADRAENAEMLTSSFEFAVREIRPVVSVVEINEAQNRVSMIENLDTY